MSNPQPSAQLGTQRDPLPYFAGRRKELAALSERLDRLCETRDPSGGMSLIVGVPGVGKTHLGMRFAEQAMRHTKPAQVAHIRLNTQTLKAPDTVVFMNFMSALGSAQVGRKVANVEDRSSANGTSVVGVSATGTPHGCSSLPTN